MSKLFFSFLLLVPIFIFPQSDKIQFELIPFSIPGSEDFSPSVYKEGILFVSNRDKKSNFLKLYYTDFKTQPIKVEIKGEKYHIGQTFYDAENDDVYITKSSDKNANFYINLAIYKGKMNEFKIENLEKLDFCKTNFSYSCPQINNNQLLIQTNEFGGHALVIYTLENKVWKNPKIIFKDKFPIVNPIFKNNETIYFASKRIGGKGGYDLYKIVKIGDQWTEEPVNLSDFNSLEDDLSILFINEKQGYISSGRDNKLSKIYKFTIE